MGNKFVTSLLCIILLVFSINFTSLAAPPITEEVVQIASFKAFAGNIKVSHNQVKLFVSLQEFIENNGKESLKEKYPSWDGESH